MHCIHTVGKKKRLKNCTFTLYTVQYNFYVLRIYNMHKLHMQANKITYEYSIRLLLIEFLAHEAREGAKLDA
jgi:hypothetical protein